LIYADMSGVIEEPELLLTPSLLKIDTPVLGLFTAENILHLGQ